MKHALLVFLVLAAGCASTNAAPAPETSPGREPTASSPPPTADAVPKAAASSAECKRLCSAYEHYRRGALIECEESDCGARRRTHPETANYGRELCDTIVAQCGSSCEVAYKDHKSAKTK